MNSFWNFIWHRLLLKYVFFWFALNFSLGFVWLMVFYPPIRHISEDAAEKWQAELKNKVAIVTGCSSGIGRELAKFAFSLGMKVVLVDINKEGMESLIYSLKLREEDYLLLHQDLADSTAAERIISSTVSKFGKLDILFNNAGYGYVSGTEKVDLEQAKRQFDVNFWAYVSLAKKAIPILKQQNWAKIVNVSSIVGEDVSLVDYRAAFYISSKQSVSAWSKLLKEELKGSKVSVLTVSPGGVATKFYEHMVGVDSDYLREKQERFRVTFDTPDFIAKEIFRALPEDVGVLYPGQGRFLKTTLEVRCLLRGDCR